MPTASTVPLIMLVAFLWFRTNGSVLSTVLFTSVFEAASALNFGNLGVSPPLFALVLCLVLKGLQGHHPKHLIRGINIQSFCLLATFTVYAVGTGIVYPLVFKGVLVLRGSTAVPLMWSVSNFAQVCYLLSSVLLYFLTVSSSREELARAINWYVNGCVVSSLIAVWQLANAIAHVPYPDLFLYSNPSHVIYRAYMINGMWRLNSTFPEASEFSTFITVGIGLLGWQVVTKPISVWRAACLLLMIIMLLMTESSLGYICLSFALVAGSILYTRFSLKHKGASVLHLVLAISALFLTITTLVLYSNVRETTTKLVRATLVDKQNSDSYRERTETHTAALETLRQTYYLGAGWGSVRASGLAFVLLGNVGILGFCLFVAFCISLFLPFFRRTKVTLIGSYYLYEQCLFGLGIMLIGLIVAGAEPVQPILWVMFGVATAARMPAQNVAHQTMTAGSDFFIRNRLPALQPVRSSWIKALKALESSD